MADDKAPAIMVEEKAPEVPEVTLETKEPESEPKAQESTDASVRGVGLHR